MDSTHCLKTDGTVRFCVAYKSLNNLTKRDPYLIPGMDKCIDSLGRATVFPHEMFTIGTGK